MKTLYEKLGGAPAIENLVTAFYQNVLADPMLQPFFQDTSIEKLVSIQKAFFCVALGGPEPKFERSLFEVHRGMGIERKHLTRFTEHLLNTLRELGVDKDDANSVYVRIGQYADDVLGEASVDG